MESSATTNKSILLIICTTILFAITPLYADNWIQDAANGCKIWNPHPQPGETIEWYGSIETNTACGYGMAVWKQKGKETENVSGQWKKGKPDGYAVWNSANGAQYAGEWKNGVKQGYGILTSPDGSIFIGAFDNNQQSIGRSLDPKGKRVDAIETPLIRSIVFKAQDAAIQARKAAAKAKVENQKGKS